MVIQLLAVSGSAAGSVRVNIFSSPSVILEFYFDSKACADILEFCGFGQFQHSNYVLVLNRTSTQLQTGWLVFRGAFR